MIPLAFELPRPPSLDEAIGVASLGDGAKPSPAAIASSR